MAREHAGRDATDLQEDRMSTYSDVTQQIGDHWMAALKRNEEAVTAVSSGISSAAATAGLRNKGQTS
jgi:hypothetical protein